MCWFVLVFLNVLILIGLKYFKISIRLIQCGTRIFRRKFVSRFLRTKYRQLRRPTSERITSLNQNSKFKIQLNIDLNFSNANKNQIMPEKNCNVELFYFEKLDDMIDIE